MNLDIALLLAQDGLTNGAIYALLALALVLVFAVTRVIFVPQGEFVSYGALTLASLQLGKVPGTAWLLLVRRRVIVRRSTWFGAVRERKPRRLPRILLANLVLPAGVARPDRVARAAEAGAVRSRSLLALALVVPLGPMLYRLAYQPLAERVGAGAAHRLGRGALRADRPRAACSSAPRARARPLSPTRRFNLGAMTVSGQSLLVVGASVALIVALCLFFERTMYGKALRATAMNRVGARLVGISADARRAA